MILHRTPLVAFAGHQIQIWEKPRIPDCTNKTDIPDSRIPIPLHGTIKEVIVQNCKWLKLRWKETKWMEIYQNTMQPTDVTLYVGMAFAQVSHWMFLTCETACPLPRCRPQASRPITMPTRIFNHKRDLFFSARKHSVFFTATTVAQCFKKKFCTV